MPADSLPSYPLTLFLRCPILLLDSLLKFRVSPVKEDLRALTGYQQALHLEVDALLCCFTVASLYSTLYTLIMLERTDAKQIDQCVERARLKNYTDCGSRDAQ